MDPRDRGASHLALMTLTAGMAALVLVLVLSLGAPAARAAEGTGAIEGTVRAAVSHEALAGIQVVAYEAGAGLPAGFATTKANGRYVLEGLSTGSYEVEFSAGFEAATGRRSSTKK